MPRRRRPQLEETPRRLSDTFSLLIAEPTLQVSMPPARAAMMIITIPSAGRAGPTHVSLHAAPPARPRSHKSCAYARTMRCLSASRAADASRRRRWRRRFIREISRLSTLINDVDASAHSWLMTCRRGDRVPARKPGSRWKESECRECQRHAQGARHYPAMLDADDDAAGLEFPTMSRACRRAVPPAGRESTCRWVIASA